MPRITALILVCLCVTAASAGPPPGNDGCFDAIEVFNGQTPFDTTGATTDGTPHALCGGGDGLFQSDVWFNYQPTFTGELTVSLCGSGFDTVLAVYSVSFCPAPDAALLACSDDACGLQSQVTVPVVPNAIYLIRVGGADGAQGAGTLTITKAFEPGDECSSCRPAEPDVATAGTTSGNRGVLDDTTCGLLDSVDEWWCWTPRAGGVVSILLHESVHPMTAAVFTGDCAALTEITCIVDGDIENLPVTAGMTYRIRFAAEIFTTSDYTWELSTSAAEPCPGDTNGDDEVDVDDLNAVVLDWGTDGSGHNGDLTGPLPGSPPDGVVNVNDLNTVIVGWGLCR